MFVLVPRVQTLLCISLCYTFTLIVTINKAINNIDVIIILTFTASETVIPSWVTLSPDRDGRFE